MIDYILIIENWIFIYLLIIKKLNKLFDDWLQYLKKWKITI